MLLLWVIDDRKSVTAPTKTSQTEDGAKYEMTIRMSDGRFLRFGDLEEFNAASREIFALTGGSSLGGQLSSLWGLLADASMKPMASMKPIASSYLQRVRTEAAAFADMFEDQLSPRAKALLKKLAGRTSSDD